MNSIVWWLSGVAMATTVAVVALVWIWDAEWWTDTAFLVLGGLFVASCAGIVAVMIGAVL